MGKVIAIGAAFACLVLWFCLCCAIVAQDSNSWWKVKTEANSLSGFRFGLYRFCLEDQINETCYRFDNKDILKFMSQVVGERANRLEIIEVESQNSKNLWIISFFFIVLCGIATILSSFAFFQAVVGKAIFLTICIQTFLTFSALILGVACVAYTVDTKNDIWPAGVKFLAINGVGTGVVDAEGRGYRFQLISAVALIVPYIIYTILLFPARKLRNENNGAKKIGRENVA